VPVERLGVVVTAHLRTWSVVALAGILALSLSGCDTAESPNAQTLAVTKSPVQLLRNEAAGRIPPATIESVSNTEDVSKSCRAEDQDPDGLMRSWHSTAQVLVEEASAWRIDAVADGIAQSFVDQGWTARPLGGSPTSHVVLLSSETSPAEIQISANRPDPDASPTSTVATVEDVTIELSVHGPCVKTEGPESAAVKKLEGRE